MNEGVKEGNLKPPDSLAQYSKWLAAFQGAQYEQSIEIPGMKKLLMGLQQGWYVSNKSTKVHIILLRS